MNWSDGERLYRLLPAVHRIRDGKTGETLRALLSIIESELETLEGDIEGLYDNWFIETCDPWVIPYIGDLVGNRPLHEVVGPRRADVARTISYRRRKATVPMLADLARNVTGWDSRVLEFFQLLSWTQNVNHVRYRLSPRPVPYAGLHPERLNPAAVSRVGTVNFRNHDLVDRVDGPFDELSHTIDVRPPCATRDRYNIRKLGVFLWRLESYEMERATPAPSQNAMDGDTAFGFHFNPLGADAPLFNRRLETDGREPERVTEARVRGAMRPLALHRDLERCRTGRQTADGHCGSDYVGDERAVEIFLGDDAIAPEGILVMDLETWHRPPPTITYAVPGGKETEIEVTAAIDPQRGRFVFATGHEPADLASNPNALTVSYHYGFSADVGGGPYRREVEPGDGPVATWSRSVSLRKGTGEADYDSLDLALDDWAILPDDQRRNAVITIIDNATYALSQNIELASREQLVIQSASGNRPTIRVLDGSAAGGDLVARRKSDDAGEGGSLILNGLLIEGGVRVSGPLRTLDVIHSTLAPGRRLDESGDPVEDSAASLSVEAGNSRLAVTLDHSIVGPLRLPDDVKFLSVRDSIIDALTHVDPSARPAAISGNGDAAGPATTLERVTVFGNVHVRELSLASEVIFTRPVTVERRQAGCVRFSFVPQGSVTPRRFRCQPDLAIRREGAGVLSRLVPGFRSTHYGDPGYAQLHRTCPVEIRTGAEDGSEMGVFAALRQPQREANLRQRLEEYLPFGLETALLYVR